MNNKLNVAIYELQIKMFEDGSFIVNREDMEFKREQEEEVSDDSMQKFIIDLSNWNNQKIRLAQRTVLPSDYMKSELIDNSGRKYIMRTILFKQVKGNEGFGENY